MTWLARSLVIALACAVAGFVVVALAGAAGLRADDQDSVDPGSSARVGLLARDGVAQFDNFALYLAD